MVFFSTLQGNEEFKLTGYGISLLHQATNGNFNLIRSALPKHASVDSKHSLSPPTLPSREVSGSNTLPPRAPDRLEKELGLARSVRRLFPTANLQEFSEHFNSLVSELRGGIPYSDRDDKHALTPGELLKFYMLSFITDVSAVRNLADQAKNGGLSLLESARCITDETRTKKFLSAVRDAVTRATGQETGTIEVIDAGCGAVPIQAIQAAILDPRVRVTALEFNPASVAVAQQVVKALGLEGQINVVQADATTYAPENKAHIIVSETLQAGLGGEPVVQILNNLHSHLRQNGRMIPERVEVKIGLVPLSEIRNSARTIRTAIEDVKVIDPQWQQTFHYRFGNPLEQIIFDITPTLPIAERSAVCVEIEVNLGNEVLSHNESLITMP